MIIKRRLQEYKLEELGSEIAIREEAVLKLEKDLARIDKFKNQYDSDSKYKLDRAMILDEISDYKLEIEMLKARRNTL